MAAHGIRVEVLTEVASSCVFLKRLSGRPHRHLKYQHHPRLKIRRSRPLPPTLENELNEEDDSPP